MACFIIFAVRERKTGTEKTTSMMLDKLTSMVVKMRRTTRLEAGPFLSGTSGEA